MSDQPDDILRTQLQKNMLEFHCGHTMFCPKCGLILDAKRSVAVDIYRGQELLFAGVLCSGCYDARKNAFQAKAEARGLRLEISDGRQLFARRTI